MSQRGSISFLDYVEAPITGIYFLVAHLVAIVTLQRTPLGSRRSRSKRLRIHGFLLLLMFLYMMDVLLYLYRVLVSEYLPSQRYEFHLFFSMTLMANLTLILFRTKSPFRHPYRGTFITSLVFEVIRCGNCVDTQEIIPLLLSSLKLVTKFTLALDWSAAEDPGDTEIQSLLGDPERDTERRDQQRRHVEEADGWFGYLKEFTIFYPHLITWGDVNIRLSIAAIISLAMVNWVLPILQLQMYTYLVDTAMPLAIEQGELPWLAVIGHLFGQQCLDLVGFDLLETIASLYIVDAGSLGLQRALIRWIMGLGMRFHLKKSSAEIQAAVQQSDSLPRMLIGAMELLFTAVKLITGSFYLGFHYGRYTVITFGITAQVYSWCSAITITWTTDKRRAWSGKSRMTKDAINIALTGYPTVADNDNVSFECERVDALHTDEVRAKMAYWLQFNYGWMILKHVLFYGKVIASLVVAKKVTIGSTTPGDFLAFPMYWSTTIAPLRDIMNKYKDFSGSLSDAERALQVYQTQPTITDANDPVLLRGEGEVEFEKVRFSYDNEVNHLYDINFVIQAGQKIAFVGQSGGGKSTILRLMLRHYDPLGGLIKINGQDVRHIAKSSLRKHVGIVSQKPYLFNRSILENVRYANLHATDQEVENACKAAAIHESIMSYKDGYQTALGEQGLELSGGQVQRLAIARVILQNPMIVILDEATSALDSESEAKVQQGLCNATKGKTTIAVAHRLSTVQKSDMIFVVEGGRIIERGQHADLVQQDGKYAHLWNLQMTPHEFSAAALYYTP